MKVSKLSNLFCVVVLILLFSTPSKGGVNEWTELKGLPDGLQLYDLIGDPTTRAGLYVGTKEGVFYHNGSGWEKFGPEGSPIKYLAASDKGLFAAGGYQLWFYSFTNKNWKPVELPPRVVPAESITMLTSIGDTLMFGTSEGRVISRAGIAWGILSSAEQTRVTAFYRFGSSSYVGTNEGLFFISNNSFEKALNVGLPEDWVTDLLAFDGHLFVSYRSKGIFYKKDADALFKSASDGLGSLSITDLIEYNDTLLAATPDKNIYSLNKSKWESFKPLSKPATKLSADRSSLYALIENQVYEIHFQTSPGDATPPSPPPSTEPELPPASTPPSPPAADTDGDGVVDASDNCPKAANVDQKDDDADGIGNVCDPDFTIVKATTPPTGGGSGCSLNASAQSSVGFIWFFTLFFFMGLALRLRPQRIKKN